MSKKNMIQLPTTPEAYDDLIRLLQAKYKFEDSSILSAVVSRAIIGMDAQTDTCTMDGLAKRMRKAMANNVADWKFNQVRHTAQIDALKEQLKINPLDQQAVDQLTKAANEGSDYAKQALAAHQQEPPAGQP